LDHGVRSIDRSGKLALADWQLSGKHLAADFLLVGTETGKPLQKLQESIKEFKPIASPSRGISSILASRCVSIPDRGSVADKAPCNIEARTISRLPQLIDMIDQAAQCRQELCAARASNVIAGISDAMENARSHGRVRSENIYETRDARHAPPSQRRAKMRNSATPILTRRVAWGTVSALSWRGGLG
jgi:hypothetical protein